MLKITRSAESWRYIPAADRALPPEQQTVFRLRPMTASERANAYDELTRTVIDPDGSTTIVRRMRQVALVLCLNHIEAVENFPAGAGVPWPDTREARLTYLDGFDDVLVEEIGNEIYDHSATGAPEKNSLPPAPTSA